LFSISKYLVALELKIYGAAF